MATHNPVFAIELHDSNRYGTVHKIGCRDLVDPEEIPFGEDPHQYIWPEEDPTPAEMYMPCTKGIVNHRTDLHSLDGLKAQSEDAAKAIRRLSRTASWDDAVRAAQLIASGVYGEHISESSLVATTVENVGHLYTDASVIHSNKYLAITLFHAATSGERDWVSLADSNISYQLNPDMFSLHPVGMTMILNEPMRKLALMFIDRDRNYCIVPLGNHSEDLLVDLFNSTNVYTSDEMERALSAFFAKQL